MSLSANEMERFYVALENKFRGGAEMVRDRQSAYLPFVKRVQISVDSGVFLDIGCGRGEWLDLLREAGVPCQGVDMNAEMVKICRSKGLDAACGNAIDYLKSFPDASLLGVSAFHVIEHVSLDVGLEMLAEIKRCLVDGGVVFFETPNPENVRVGSHTFFIDPTHTKPVPPHLLAFMFEFSGFEVNEVVRLHPATDFNGLAPLSSAESYLLGHFCGPQDYAVVGAKGKVRTGIFPVFPKHSSGGAHGSGVRPSFSKRIKAKLRQSLSRIL